MSLFAFGNRKLPNTTAIFNMSSAQQCPSNGLGLCQLADPNKCYALKAERMYKAVLPYRHRQSLFWANCKPTEFVSQLLKEIGRKKIKHLRLNEAGDFFAQKCVRKAEQIAKLLKEKHNITTYVYTARKDLNFSRRRFLIVNGSNFMVDNRFTSVDCKEKAGQQTMKDALHAEGQAICIGDCRKCRICSVRGGLEVFVKQH